MKKVLILSYFSSPGNFAGSYRIKSWADYLHNYGYYPIIVTRHWNENETDYTAISDKKVIEKTVNEKHTIYRLPYYGSFRDRLVHRYGKKAVFIGKFFSFFQLLGQNIFMGFTPFANLYYFSRDLIKSEKDLNIVIASGGPFIQFRFCYLLKNKYPNIKWIADYRDEWNSYYSYGTRKEPLGRKFLIKIESPFEKKWLSNASKIITVSEVLKEQISKFLNFKGPVSVVLNGFDSEDFSSLNWKTNNNFKQFQLLYSGTLYPFQELGIMIQGIIKFLQMANNSNSVKIVFAGLKRDEKMTRRILELFAGHEKHLVILPRLAKKKFMKLLHQSHVLLLFPYLSVKGCYSSKIFEYLASCRPILMAPPDDGLLNSFIKNNKAGFIGKSSSEVTDILCDLFMKFQNNVTFINNNRKLYFFSREKQTELLSEEINKTVFDDY
jgi:glycosyltransferase involved in cell wall biosynthesis